MSIADDSDPVMELLSQDHTILERPFMEFRPFGVDDRGESIQDFAGLVIKDNVEYLEECVRKTRGEEADRVVENLARLLNERIRDSAYHVTPTFLKNVWNSYSYEFAAYLRERYVAVSENEDLKAFDLTTPIR